MDGHADHTRRDGKDAFLLRLALQAEWLALMVEWDLEQDVRTAEGRARPFYGVRTPMCTKTTKRQAPQRVPVALALAS